MKLWRSRVSEANLCEGLSLTVSSSSGCPLHALTWALLFNNLRAPVVTLGRFSAKQTVIVGPETVFQQPPTVIKTFGSTQDHPEQSDALPTGYTLA